MPERNVLNLSASRLSTVCNFIILARIFSKVGFFRGKIIVHFVDDQLQKTEINTCGIFQLYVYDDLFAPDCRSSIVNDLKLTRNNVWKQLYKIFELDKNINKERIAEFAEKHSVKVST